MTLEVHLCYCFHVECDADDNPIVVYGPVYELPEEQASYDRCICGHGVHGASLQPCGNKTKWVQICYGCYGSGLGGLPFVSFGNEIDPKHMKGEHIGATVVDRTEYGPEIEYKDLIDCLVSIFDVDPSEYTHNCWSKSARRFLLARRYLKKWKTVIKARKRLALLDVFDKNQLQDRWMNQTLILKVLP